MDTMRRLSLVRLGALALAAGLAAGCAKAPAKFNGVDITGADYGRSLSMTDADGKRRSLDEFRGKVVVVFFGYTQCPDVCPTTLAELAAIKQKLGPAGDKLVGVFVSVDPERDTPQVLKAYVNSFGADFVALRGSLDETKAVARDFKVFFAKVPGKVEGSYTMDHTAGSYVFDTQGRLRLFERYGTAPDALAGDLKALIEGA
jgi:protein SCO1